MPIQLASFPSTMAHDVKQQQQQTNSSSDSEFAQLIDYVLQTQP